MTASFYKGLTYQGIVDDLAITVGDLYLNARQLQLAPLVEQLNSAAKVGHREPTEKLIALMEELLPHDANLLAPAAIDLMNRAGNEIERIAGNDPGSPQ